MQQRHSDRQRYFRELAATSGKYFIPYIMQWHDLSPGTSVLEIGCGEGGNLLPPARLGCEVTGVDISATRIRDAVRLFGRERVVATFVCDDIFNVTGYDHRFDIVLCHDVLEHIGDKRALLCAARTFLRAGGVLFVAFPAWQMPFGGHQQICRSALLSRLPFVHLLPRRVYRRLLAFAGESDEMIRELLDIRRTGVTVEEFEALAASAGWEIADRSLYLINPHYEIKYGLTPRRMPAFIANVPHIRNYFSTSCFYLLRPCSPSAL